MSVLFRTSRFFLDGVKPALFATLLIVCTIASGSLSACFAQSATTGAISGTVADSSGALLPGVTVTVTSVDTGISRVVKSNGSGEYTVDELEPGSYTAGYVQNGFQSYEEKAITVTVGSISTVSPRLKAGSVTQKVEVTDDSPILHTQDDAISTTIDQSTIQNLPINGRRWSDFARLTPGVVSQPQGFGLLSFRGISYLLNNNTIDGADDNQAYYSEARGRTRTAFSVPPSAIQEFQVNTSNYSAQYGRAAGGVINTVTKSGSNTFHGEVFFFDRDNNLGGATNPYTLLSVPNGAGGYNQVPTKQTDWRKNWGFTLGGPLLRDKLFFIYTYDQERRNFPGISRPTDPNDFLAPSNATLPSGETCSTTAFTATTLSLSAEGDYNSCLIAALLGVSFQAGSAYYQQGLGILQSFIGVVPRRQDQVINLPKVDYQINERERLSVLYNRMRYSSPSGLYSQSTDNEGRSGWGNDNVKEDFVIARLTSVLSSSLLNEAVAQYGRDFEFDLQQPPLPNELPLAHNSYAAAAGTQIGFYFNGGIYDGSNPDLSRYADPDERRLQLLDGLTWSHGKHVSKAGLEYNKVSDFENTLYNGNGSYSYDWTYNYIADYLNATTGIGGPVSPTGKCATGVGPPTCYTQTYYSFSQEYGNPKGLIATREYAGYVTDDWRALTNLTLTFGVRYEYEYVPPSPFVNNGNPALLSLYNSVNTAAPISSNALPQTANRPDDRNNIGPRVGFSWDPYKNGKTILRGGYGMYYGRIINSNIVQTYLESGAPSAQLSVSSLYPGACGPTFPAIYSSFTQITTCAVEPTVAFFSPHMQNPQVHEADLAVEQNMGHNTTLGITYMMSLGRELPTAIDTNFNIGATGYGTFALSSPTSSSALKTYMVSSNSEAPTSLANYPQPPATGGYIVLPAGGKAPPVFPSGYQQKFFLNGTRPNPAYYQILEVQSSVNSSYNALAFQVDHRFERGFSLLTNFTWSHALDENPYESTVVPSYTLSDPTNPRADYGNSSTDVRLRYVGAMVYQPQTNFHGVLEQVLGGWRIAPLVQIQSGLPYSPTISTSSFKTVTLTTGGATQNLAGTGINGAGSGSTRVPWIGRDSYTYPKTAVFDLRVGKNFYLSAIPRFERLRLEVFAEAFNVMNHQNITAVNTEAYTLGDVANAPVVQTLTPYNGFATYTNSNSNYTYSPRQMQLAARLHF
jgi:Carboxypeptidase regulatory-like domain/TonB-dependent Receptor Plug Domain